MATGNMNNFNGKIGTAVGYELYGKQRIRSLPRSYKQSPASQEAAKIFGKASELSTCLRTSLGHTIPVNFSLKMQNRLTSAIRKYLHETRNEPRVTSDHLPFIEGFQFFDDEYKFSDRIKLPLTVTLSSLDTVELSIPAFIPVKSIESPQNVSLVSINVGVVCMGMEEGVFTKSDTQWMFEYDKIEQPEKTITLNLETNKNSLLITVVAINYFTRVRENILPIKDRTSFPAAIVSAMYL